MNTKNETGDRPCVIVTGGTGGIGRALVQAYAEAGYSVISVDRMPSSELFPQEVFVEADLQRTVQDQSYANQVFNEVRRNIQGTSLKVLVNNAALQILGQVEELTRDDWQVTLDTNLLAPFFWTREFLPELSVSDGIVINMSSIHARLTKRLFSAYATSKAALSGLTRSLAVELGDRVRVVALEPAAVDTEMLKAGFAGNDAAYLELIRYHPTKCIGKPEELGRLAVMLSENALPFLNGSVIQLDGGISGCLHDPG